MMNILLAEDDRISQIAMQKLLELRGFSVDAVSNGIECLASFLTNTYDLVLMDMCMPHFSGIQAAGVIKKLDDTRKNRIPIIAMSTSLLTFYEISNYALLFDGYVSKPFDISELLSLIETVMNTHYSASQT